jgi:hypothetical protein
MMATTTRSSISVNPFDFLRFILDTLLMRPPLFGGEARGPSRVLS